MRNYTGKKVYLGIDVHKKTYAVTAVCEGQVAKKDTMAADPIRLISYCQKYFPGAQIESAYETGFCGFYLHRRLEEQGIKNKIVHAAGIEVAVRDKVLPEQTVELLPTVGAVGVWLMTMTPVPSELVQPLVVAVTENVPA